MVDYRAWLQSTGLSTVLRLDTISTSRSKATLRFTTKDSHNWKRLVAYTDSSLHLSLATALFNQFIFSMDLQREQGEITIDAKDATIFIRDEEGDTHVELGKKMGEVSDNADISLAGIKAFADLNTFSTTKSIETLKVQLEKGLYSYFKNFKARLEEYNCKPIYEQNNHLVIEVSNIVDAVLKEGYFEHLQFIFTFTPQVGKTAITYELYGKYGAGLLWAPQESRYCSMLPKYQNQVERFNLIISNEIGKIVN